MALDEAIAYAVEAGRVPPTVRFYAWDRPTVSLAACKRPGGRWNGRRAIGWEWGSFAARPADGPSCTMTNSRIACAFRWTGRGRAYRWGKVSGGSAKGWWRVCAASVLRRRLGKRPTLGPPREAHACFLTPRMPAVLAEGKKARGVGAAATGWRHPPARQPASGCGSGDAPGRVSRLAPGGSGQGRHMAEGPRPGGPTRSSIERAPDRRLGGGIEYPECGGRTDDMGAARAERLAVTRYATPAWTWRR